MTISPASAGRQPRLPCRAAMSGSVSFLRPPPRPAGAEPESARTRGDLRMPPFRVVFDLAGPALGACDLPPRVKRRLPEHFRGAARPGRASPAASGRQAPDAGPGACGAPIGVGTGAPARVAAKEADAALLLPLLARIPVGVDGEIGRHDRTAARPGRCPRAVPPRGGGKSARRHR